MQCSGYLLCLGNRKRNIFLRLLLAFSKLVCSPVAGVITAVSALRGLVSRQVQDMTTVIHSKKFSQDPFLHIQGRVEIIYLFICGTLTPSFQQPVTRIRSQVQQLANDPIKIKYCFYYYYYRFTPICQNREEKMITIFV